MQKELLLSQFASMVWAMEPGALRAAAGVLARWRSGGPVSAEPRAAGQRPPTRASSRVQGGAIAVIPVHGSIVQRAGMMTEWCGGTSTQQISAALAEARNDETVGQVLMEFDTPGGSVYGVGELSDEIHEARKTKPVVGIANSLSASAGYWLMAQCSECYVSPGGEVGSIGVWTAHEDLSKALEAEGVHITLVSAGRYKVEGNPYEPLDRDAAGFMQSRVEDYYGAFVDAVARGRGVAAGTVRNGMGQGRVLGARQALAEKMVDGVLTLEQLIAQMRDGKRRGLPASSKQQAGARRRQLQMLELENPTASQLAVFNRGRRREAELSAMEREAQIADLEASAQTSRGC